MSQNQRKLGATRAIGLLPFTLLAAVGCAQIIGLGDYTVASDNGGAGGATGGKAGTGGKSGGAGRGGTTAAAGEAGEQNLGGQAGAPPNPTGAVGCDGKTAITVNSQVVRSCVLSASCSPFYAVRSISECVSNNTQDAFAGERCNLRSKTCADYEACMHVGIAGDDLCPASKSGTNYCAGTKAVSCPSDGSFPSWVDCVGQGATGCGIQSDGTADCTLPAQDCSNSTSTDYVCSTEAEPKYKYYCADGEAYGIACGDFSYCGYAASNTGDGGAGGATTVETATCYLTAASCAVAGTQCSDNVAKVCTDGGEYDYDCGSVGLTCAVGGKTDASSNYCLAPGCKPADVDGCTESCNGSSLTFCYGGAPVSVNCVDYGFSSCGTFTSTEGLFYAACTNQ